MNLVAAAALAVIFGHAPARTGAKPDR